MSYARMGWGDSDVYVFAVDNALECCQCWFEEFNFYAFSTAEMVDHLEAHIAAGHMVPADVIPSLRRDDAENFQQVQP